MSAQNDMTKLDESPDDNEKNSGENLNCIDKTIKKSEEIKVFLILFYFN